MESEKLFFLLLFFGKMEDLKWGVGFLPSSGETQAMVYFWESDSLSVLQPESMGIRRGCLLWRFRRRIFLDHLISFGDFLLCPSRAYLLGLLSFVLTSDILALFFSLLLLGRMLLFVKNEKEKEAGGE